MSLSSVLSALPRAAWFAVTAILVAIIAGLVVLYVATPLAQRPNVWQYLGGVGVAVGLSAPSVAAWVRASLTHKEVQETTATVQRVEAQTNGVLDQRINTQVRAAIADFYGDLVRTYPKLPALGDLPPQAPPPTPPATPAPDHAPGVVQ